MDVVLTSWGLMMGRHRPSKGTAPRAPTCRPRQHLNVRGGGYYTAGRWRLPTEERCETIECCNQCSYA